MPFIPLAVLNEKRRQLLHLHENFLFSTHQREKRKTPEKNIEIYTKTADYTFNISNKEAEKFYQKMGVYISEHAWECQNRMQQKIVMKTKYCLRFQLGMCLKNKNNSQQTTQLFLAYQQKRFVLQFNCQQCEMTIRPLL